MAEAALAAGLAQRWYTAWNDQSLERILALYSENVEFSSPLVAQIGGAADGVLRSKTALAAYFEKALARSTDLKFKPIAECKGARGSTLIYANHRGQIVAESHDLDEAGLIARANVAYAPLPKHMKV